MIFKFIPGINPVNLIIINELFYGILKQLFSVFGRLPAFCAVYTDKASQSVFSV